MNTNVEFDQALKRAALVIIICVLLLVAFALTRALFPSDIPGANGVSRLVDPTYHVVCYYNAFSVSCQPLVP